jgi:hypothetical protein
VYFSLTTFLRARDDGFHAVAVYDGALAADPAPVAAGLLAGAVSVSLAPGTPRTWETVRGLFDAAFATPASASGSRMVETAAGRAEVWLRPDAAYDAASLLARAKSEYDRLSARAGLPLLRWSAPSPAPTRTEPAAARPGVYERASVAPTRPGIQSASDAEPATEAPAEAPEPVAAPAPPTPPKRPRLDELFAG